MEFNLEAIIWYLMLLDAIGAVLVTLFFADWYREKFETLHKHFPLTRAWCLVYLGLVCWAGWLLYRLRVLPW